MNALSKAQQAYSAARGTIKTPRRIEYEALANITTRLKAGAESRSHGFSDLATAIHDNRKIWTIFATNAVSDLNPLPESLRARIVYLSEFVGHHSSKVLRRKASVQPLLDVNVAVMRGLHEGGGG